MRRQINKIVIKPVNYFFEMESSSGILLFIAAVVAIVWANSPFSGAYDAIWQHKIGLEIEGFFELKKPVFLWINDGLMAIFFFLIGLEIKREIVVGELSSMRKAAFPFIAALGGILVPVGLFFYLNDNPVAESGWGIPMATDIAFSLAILKLLGSRVPIGLKVFLTAFAIIDDLAAVLVIALFYSASIQWILIFISLGLLIILFVLSSFKFYSRYIFFIIGLVVWFLFLKSGVHPTIAGVLLAFAIPMRRGTGLGNFIGNTHDSIEEIKKAKAHKTAPETLLTYEQINALDYIVSETEKVQSPLQMLEHKLHGWVAFVILPLFAFANAGVTISGSAAIDFSLSLTIGLSLLAGKVVGVSLFSIAGVKFGLADLPRNTGYADIIGVGFLAGIGFTMSIFITNLAYASPELVSAAKVGILAGSFAAGILGYVVLRLFMRKAVK